MLIILSPSKTLDETPMQRKVKATLPEFMAKTQALAEVMKKKSAADLKKLMGISDKLAALNHARFQSFDPVFTDKNAKPALFMFKGDVYAPMQVAEYDAATLDYAQKHLRILSGFYGLLRPLDLMQPYRLEMGTSLPTPKAKNLYTFWGSRLSEVLNDAGEGMRNPLLINLASEEYFKAVDAKTLKLPLVQVQFKEYKNGTYKIIGLMAKRARGMMTDYILQNRVDTLEELKEFNAEGYRFQPHMSDGARMVFTRGDMA